MHSGKIACFTLALLTAAGGLGTAAPPQEAKRGRTIVGEGARAGRPERFPHRIWAACDFEGQTPDYAWFGLVEKTNIPAYPGNATALRAEPKPHGNVSARMAGMNPVPGPRMGKVNHLYARYFIKRPAEASAAEGGAAEATFQHFSLTTEDNQHISVSGLAEGHWAEVTLNFTRDAKRNDGSPGSFGDGERMDDFKVFLGKLGADKNAAPKDWDLLLDDVIFFAEDPALPPEPEPFPNRVILLAAFDTGITRAERPKYFPGDFEAVAEGLPAGSFWGAARAVAQKEGRVGKLIRLQIEPPRPVGAHTKLRFRYHLQGAAAMTVQIFDLTAGDNRHIRLRDLRQKEWTTIYLDFTRDSKRNDGSIGPFTAGNRVDDLFFFLDGEEGARADLLIDEVVLFDAGK